MNSWIQTYTGKRVYPLNMKVNDIDPVDIAHALALKCRFTGHCISFYSVAQHSIIVSNIVPSKDTLWGLLHDAAEAYLPDVARPIKSALIGFKEIETQVIKVIAEFFKLSWPEPASIKSADLIALKTEKRDLMSPKCNYLWEFPQDIIPLSEEIVPWSWLIAESEFLNRLQELT